MKEKRIAFLLVSVTFGIISCSQKKSTNYTGSIICDKEISLQSTDLNTDFIISSSPREMLIWDSLLIVEDSYAQSECIHLFNKETGKWIISFGSKGQGPGELMRPIDLWIDKENQNIAAYSKPLNKIVYYDIKSIVKDSLLFYSESKLENPTGLPVSNLHASENNIYVSGFTKQMRFGIIEDNKVEPVYNEFPLLKNDVKEEENVAIISNGSDSKISPNSKHMVQGTYLGAIIEFFNINEDNSFTSTSLNTYIYPYYDIVQGIKPFGITWSEETTFGFHRFYANNDYVFALFNGEKASEGAFHAKSIVVFDWTGKALTKYKLNEAIEVFTIDEEQQKIYAITASDDEDMKIVTFNIR